MRYLALLIFLSLALAQPVSLVQAGGRGIHSLLWLPDGRILLGHHDGVRISTDGGRSWGDLYKKTDFEALSLVLGGNRVLVAGHGVLAEWRGEGSLRLLKPKGLPANLEAYTLNPKNPRQHFAWDMNQRLFGSSDGGQTWRKLPAQGLPPPDPSGTTMVHALAVGAGSELYLSGMGVGLWVSYDSGNRFTPLSSPETEITTLVVASDGSLWAGGIAGLWRRAGSGWLRQGQGSVLVLALNPRNPLNLLWADIQWQLWWR
ncbi:sialidase family protein [Meiothermus granaticius]|uniref:Ycf48-like protein n=1 Tax=Meiothermus granaticius NBRC 107808 TaxID=1227551 RepID=A0A399FAA1_9DEIN|nr:sialidase family protein [Meiothermus granaticius]MCL6526376.1 glycoside hydrolase [Thermaceae bacterium]RIH93524.1 hypothetical protein Mgrana_00578 [Meiothermus granaticius NBRC 107808]GEM86020.1 S-layer protein [Meiothermus granaticius NBRC 107808]